ncbi:MAG: hypothetical protein JW965_04050 [Bacteroidales bacterium]|nr:hypothetical protein [Bacteroidales bacterium]
MRSTLFIIGVLALILGSIEYFAGRPDSIVHFQLYFSNASIAPAVPDIYGALGNYAPTFFHALSFSLISISLLAGWFTKEFLCIFWFLLDSLLELGQLIITRSLAYKIIPGSLSESQVINRVIDFFEHGTYDLLDVLSIFLGCLIAYLIGVLISK